MKKLSEILPDYKSAFYTAESPIEKIMYYTFKKIGIDCELQYWIKGIRLDIAIPSIKLAIECDGSAYHQDRLKDAARDRATRLQGWQVERYTGSEIVRNSIGIAVSIARRYGLIREIDDYDERFGLVEIVQEVDEDEEDYQEENH